ncbi:protein rtoA-like [Maniola hyperantus]|uniref:protein rtoA-like n=1 Tax=Aphantopus hyperantus TaxID=2795564 RepID=UPI00374A1779
MATKLIVALACFALCNANPTFSNGYIFRNGRGYSVGQGYSTNPDGQVVGSATSDGGVLHAYGSASTDDQNQLGRNAYGGPYPGQAVAKAEVYDGPEARSYEEAKAIDEARYTLSSYTVPDPAVVSYQRNFETPAEIVYEYTGNAAPSSAITVAKTQGYGSASSTSQTDLGLTSAASQTNGGYASSAANNALNSAVVSTNSQGIASSKANINSLPGLVISSARANELRGHGWRFGTAYNLPIPGQAQVYSQANGGSAKSTAHTDGVVTTADAQGYGSSNANANLNSGSVNSAANSNGLGYGAFRYSAGNQLGSAQSTINNGLGNIKSYANSNGYGNANSHADINEQGSLSSVSNSNGYGAAVASANSAPGYAVFRTDGFPYAYSAGPSVVTQTSGQGSASARSQGLNSGYRVINSAANSYGYGAAQANASA